MKITVQEIDMFLITAENEADEAILRRLWNQANKVEKPYFDLDTNSLGIAFYQLSPDEMVKTKS